MTGYASWYGGKFHGRLTASGEKYDMYAMTAAHRTLPFQTRVRVRNLDNQQFTVVRITDRGPFVRGRIIDLSLAAARQIGLVATGTARVKLEVLTSAPSRGNFFVQLGSFREAPHAQRMKQKIQRSFPQKPLKMEQYHGLTKILSGPWRNRTQADQQLSQFSQAGFSGFVLRR